MSPGLPPRRRNRHRISSLDPRVYQQDPVGFLRGLRAIHRAADLGCDTTRSYLIVEYGRVVGVGGLGPMPSMVASDLAPDFRRRYPGRRTVR